MLDSKMRLASLAERANEPVPTWAYLLNHAVVIVDAGVLDHNLSLPIAIANSHAHA